MQQICSIAYVKVIEILVFISAFTIFSIQVYILSASHLGSKLFADFFQVYSRKVTDFSFLFGSFSSMITNIIQVYIIAFKINSVKKAIYIGL